MKQKSFESFREKVTGENYLLAIASKAPVYKKVVKDLNGEFWEWKYIRKDDTVIMKNLTYFK